MSAPRVRRIKADPYIEVRKVLRTVLRMNGRPLSIDEIRKALFYRRPRHDLKRSVIASLLIHEVKHGRVQAVGNSWRWVQQAAVAEPEPQPADSVSSHRIQYVVTIRVRAEIQNDVSGDWAMGPICTETVVLRGGKDSPANDLEPVAEGFSRAQIFGNVRRLLQRYLQKIGATR